MAKLVDPIGLKDDDANGDIEFDDNSGGKTFLWKDTVNNLNRFQITLSGALFPVGSKLYPASDSTTALNIAQANGTSLVTFDTTNSRVGIGMTSPSQKLDVSGTIRGIGLINTGIRSYFSGIDGGNNHWFSANSSAAEPTGLWLRLNASPSTGSVGEVLISPDNAGGLIVKNGGNVGIGTTNPSSFQIQVAGHVGPNADNTYDLGSSSIKWRDVYCTRAAFNGSDLRLKRDIQDTSLGLGFINLLRPVAFQWKSAPGVRQGFIAQELQSLFAKHGIEFAGLKYDKDNDSYSLSYTDFIAPLVKAVQELSHRVEEVETQCRSLQPSAH